MVKARTREYLAGGHVKGSMVRAHLQWVRQNFGEEQEKAILASLAPENRTEVDGLLASTWCSLESLVRLDRAIAAATGRDETELMSELGRASAEINLSTVYRAFRRTEIHDFFQRSAARHKQFQDFGVSTYLADDETHGTMTIRDAGAFSPVFCASSGGYYAEVIRLHGGNAPVAEETACVCAGDPACVWQVRWS